MLAKESGSGSGGARAEEFRNDAFGNVVRRRTRRTAGVINDVPFANEYSPLGELMTSFAQISSPPGQYDREDQLTQQFASGGQLVKQSQVVKIPNGGSVTQQVAARHYYGADDRLTVVQRYSYRSLDVGDGTWEEYWYDALGRRVLTRVRRDPSAIPASLSGPLCSGASVLCRSYTERVWWDGDQALVEQRTADGTSDVSNSGVVRNIHALTLDEPVALIADDTRIINYNWRGQAMSSVFLNGGAGDISLGNTATQVDWPAATQAETYFAASPDAAPSNTAKRWLGTFVANGQGTTGMLYRRNRYFDPKSGQFTQADPIGIAGGMNVFGFANGDPINYSDPFGLCPQWLTGRPCSGATDLGSGFVPGLSTGIDVATAISGQNPLTGEDVGILGRGIALAGVLTPASGGQIRGVGKIVSGLTERFGEPVTRALKNGASQLEFTNSKNGVKFVVRGPEAHPIKPGGPPVMHTNVEVHKPAGNGRFNKIGNAHLDENGRPIHER